MNFALRVIAVVVVIAGLSSSNGVALPLPNTESRGNILSAPRRTVFVNKAELARLHPDWRDLSDMKKAIAGALRAAPSGASLGAVKPGRTRSELAAKAAAEASAALDGLEARKYAALKARRDSMKSQMMKSAEAEWKAEARTVQQAAAAQTKSIDETHSADLVNARLRIAAAQVASKVSKLEGSGVDKAATEQDLLDAKLALDKIAGIDSAEKNRVDTAAKARIDEVRGAAERKIDERLNTYELDQRSRIASSMAVARTETARELGPSSAPVLFTAKSVATNLASLESTASALETRIDEDVDLVVRGLAADRGLRVVFDRRGNRMPDATTVFANLIRKHGWNAGGPVLTGVGSS